LEHVTYQPIRKPLGWVFSVHTQKQNILVDEVIIIATQTFLVPPENTIVSFFRSFYAMTIMLQFCHTDGAGLRHGETLQYHPSLAVQQFGFQVDLCSMTSESGRYGNS
jgi:hypothetical protein